MKTLFRILAFISLVRCFPVLTRRTTTSRRPLVFTCATLRARWLGSKCAHHDNCRWRCPFCRQFARSLKGGRRQYTERSTGIRRQNISEPMPVDIANAFIISQLSRQLERCHTNCVMDNNYATVVFWASRLLGELLEVFLRLQ